MKCKNCGSEIPMDSVFCPECGTRVRPKSLTPFDWMELSLKKYATFSGRAGKSEFWWFALFNSFIGLISFFIARVIEGGIFFYCFVCLPLVIPTIAVSVRRLHDIGKSGWFLLLEFTIIGEIPLLIWWLKKGDTGSNQYGPEPIR